MSCIGEDCGLADGHIHPCPDSRKSVESQLASAVRQALAVVDDPTREDLVDTPKRWAKMFAELTGGHKFEFTTFKNTGYNQMVVEAGIPFYTFCAHHILPFFGTAAVAYIPGERVVGISKLCRTVEHYARSLQMQERMTQQIADRLDKELLPKGVGVVLRARHLCQEMRGIRKRGVETVTSCVKGLLMDDYKAREEFMRLAHMEE